MPPRFVYWTILAGGLPTAFRATERDELMPTFKRILEKHPDAEMKYFARGRLWNSPEEAKADLRARPPRDGRGRDWRPGGEHRDPRQKFKDAKKDRNQRWRQEKHERRAKGTFEPRGPRQPHGDPRREPAAFKPRRERPFKPTGDRPGKPAAPKRAPFNRESGPKRPPFNREGGRPPFQRDGAPGRAPYKTRWEKEQDNEKKKRGRS